MSTGEPPRPSVASVDPSTRRVEGRESVPVGNAPSTASPTVNCAWAVVANTLGVVRTLRQISREADPLPEGHPSLRELGHRLVGEDNDGGLRAELRAHLSQWPARVSPLLNRLRKVRRLQRFRFERNEFSTATQCLHEKATLLLEKLERLGRRGTDWTPRDVSGLCVLFHGEMRGTPTGGQQWWPGLLPCSADYQKLQAELELEFAPLLHAEASQVAATQEDINHQSHLRPAGDVVSVRNGNLVPTAHTTEVRCDNWPTSTGNPEAGATASNPPPNTRQAFQPTAPGTPAGDDNRQSEFAELLGLTSRLNIKGKGRTLIECVVKGNGEVRLADLALELKWGNTDDCYNSAQQRLNGKLRTAGWEVYRADNKVKAKKCSIKLVKKRKRVGRK